MHNRSLQSLQLVDIQQHIMESKVSRRRRQREKGILQMGPLIALTQVEV